MRGAANIILLLLVCILPATFTAFAQAPDTAWTRIFGGYDDDIINAIQQTADNGYILAGYSGEGMFNHPYNFLLIKTNQNGDTVWSGSYGGFLEEAARSMIITSDSMYVIAGYSKSYGAGGKDAYIIKIDESGDTLWTGAFGGADNDEAWSVLETPDGGYLVAGYTQSFGAGASDVYLIRLDTNGNTIWMKTIGDSLFQEARSIAPTVDSCYIIAGVSGAVSTNVYLLKVDENGDTLWTKSYDSVHRDVGNFVQQTSDGGYIIAATSCGTTPDDGCDGYLIKTDGFGDTLWTACTFGDWASSVRQTAGGDFLAVGGIYDDIPDPPEYYLTVTKISSNGDTLWTDRYEDGSGNSLILTGDGGFIIAGEHIIYGCYYILGDVNGSQSYNALDITFSVSYFKGGESPRCPECPHSPQWHYCGDVNGSCSYNGLDITYGVAYFKGGPEPVPIPDFPPGGNTDVYLLKFSSQ